MAVGYAGIAFVLMQAATGLERRQKEKYGGGEADEAGGAYEAWVARSWPGPLLASKPPAAPAA